MAELLDLVRRAEAALAQVKGYVAARVKQHGDGPPVLSPADLERVEKLGSVAHRHLERLEKHGSLTLGDSLAIRRELYGENIRSTANLFGRKNSGALFYRQVEYCTKRNNSHAVDLTEGRRIAKL